MKKTKRILSLLTALTITASAFASLAIPASATDTPITGASFDFDEEDSVALVGSGSHTVQYGAAVGKVSGDTTNTTNVFHAALDNQSGGRTATYKFPKGYVIAGGTDVIKLDFNWYATTSGTDNEQGVILVDNEGKQIVDVSVNAAGNVLVNGTQQDLSSGTWYKVSAILDFETKRIIKVELANFNGGDSKVAIADRPFKDTVADGIAGFYFEARRKNNIYSDIRLDNISASTITDEYYKVTLTVKDSDGSAVENAAVTLGDTKDYVTDKNGQIITKLAAGSYDYTVQKAGYEATAGEADDATGTIVVSNAAVEENVTYSMQVYDAVPEEVTMTGGQLVMTAPHTGDKTSSAKYEVTVIDQNGVPIDDADVAWKIEPENDKVSITDGVVTVKSGFDAGESHVKSFTVTATASKNEESKDATASISISDYLFYEPGVDASSYGETETHAVGNKNYITTGSTKNLNDEIVFPEAIEFKTGTAFELSYDTAITNKSVYTFRRSVVLSSNAEASEDEESDVEIISLDYVNNDIGTNASWSSSNSTLGTVFGSVSGVGSWVTVKVIFKTNANGVTRASLSIGDSDAVDLGEVEAKNLGKIKLVVGDCGNSTDRYVAVKDIVAQELDSNMVDVVGPNKFTSISGVTLVKEYEASPLLIEDGETFTWTTTIENATITVDPDDSTKATLTVPDTVTSGGTITVTSSKSTAEKPKTSTMTVAISPARIESYDLVGSKTLAYEDGLTESYAITNVKDQNGDDITEYVIPAWSIKGAEPVSVPKATIPVEKTGSAVAIFTTYAENALESVSVKPINIPADATSVDIEGAPGQKVMIWDSLNNMEPIGTGVVEITGEAPSVTYITNSGTLTVNEKENVTLVASAIGETIEIPVTIADFSKIIDAEEGDVDVSDLVTYGATTFSVVLDNGTVLTKTAADDKITLTADEIGDAAEAEVAPVYETEMDTEVEIPPASYDITVTVNNGSRTDLYANDQLVFNNLNQYTDGFTVVRNIQSSASYTTNGVVIGGGSVTFRYEDDKSSGTTITGVKFVKTPSIITRKPQMFVLGDSLVADYYGVAPEGQEGIVRTGWGQVLQNYIADMEVVNIANSGACTDDILATQLTRIAQSTQSGDIVVIESGYNDNGHKNTHGMTADRMKSNMAEMVKIANSKGAKVVFVTPNASWHDYKESVAWSSSLIDKAKELNVDYIDLSKLSYEFFNAKYSTLTDRERQTIIAGDYTHTGIYNNATWTEDNKIGGDKALHSTQNAANCWAAIVASELGKLGVATTDHEYTFNDGKNDITVSVAAMTAAN